MEELNKSCDQCGKKKRKCPGGKPGKPCSRCLNSAETCTYSKRRPRTPSSQVQAQRLRRAAACSLLEQHSKPSLKRYRWSASPATGLVGLQENGFLCDFFASFGFMPLATESGIRETMVAIMTSPQLQQPRHEEDHLVDDKFDGGLPERDFGRALGHRQSLVDPSRCTFWCAIAIGALVTGRPIESVAKYTRLAREAITGFSGPASPEMVKAWASLGYLHGFMDAQAEFHEYLDLAKGFLRDTGVADDLPVGLAEMFQAGETIKIFAEDVDPEERKAILAQERSRPKLGIFAGGGEISRCVWQSARIFEQAIGSGIFFPRGASNIGGGDLGDDGRPRNVVDSQSEPECVLDYEEELNIRAVPFPARVAELRPDSMTAKKVDIMAELLQFRLLEKVAEIPSFRVGIAALIINDHLLFERVAKGDAPGALERAARIVEVFERYPGVCRFKLGAHKAHIMISILVALDSPQSRELYLRARAAYNLTRPAVEHQIPPLEEWRGVAAFCGRVPCRSAEACGRLAFASSLGGVAIVERDEEQDVGSNESRQEDLDGCLTFVKATATTLRLPLTMFGAHSGMECAVPVESSKGDGTCSIGGVTSVGSNQDALSGSSGVGSNVAREPSCDLADQDTDMLMLATGVLRNYGPENEALAAEDWLDISHALLEKANESARVNKLAYPRLDTVAAFLVARYHGEVDCCLPLPQRHFRHCGTSGGLGVWIHARAHTRCFDCHAAWRDTASVATPIMLAQGAASTAAPISVSKSSPLRARGAGSGTRWAYRGWNVTGVVGDLEKGEDAGTLVGAAGRSSSGGGSTVASKGKQNIFKTLWEFSRPHTMIGTAVAIPAIGVFAGPPGIFPGRRFFLAMVWALVPSLLINVYITGLNQITDVEIDKINKPYLPIPAGNLTPRGAKTTVSLCLLAGVALGLAPCALGSPGLALTVVLSVMIGTSYSLPPLRLKRFPQVAALCILVVRGSIINGGFFSHAQLAGYGLSSEKTALWALTLPFRDAKCALALAYFTVFAVVIALMKDVPDVAGDRKFNIPSFSVVLGEARLFTFARRLLTALLWSTAAALGVGAKAAAEASLPWTAASRGFVAVWAVVFGQTVRGRAAKTNPKEPKEVYHYYMFLWKIFYMSYLFLPLAR
eukprot:g4594.t1